MEMEFNREILPELHSTDQCNMILVLRTHLRPSIKVNSLIQRPMIMDDRIIRRDNRTNGLGRRGCDGITGFYTLTYSSEIYIDFLHRPACMCVSHDLNV